MDKAKQVIALFGGMLSAFYTFLMVIGVQLEWFNEKSIEAFGFLLTSITAFGLTVYGIWKNTYLVTPKAKEQEEELKKKGLK